MEPTLFEEYSESDRQDLIVSYSIEIQYLSKLYVMMALQFLLTIILTYVLLHLTCQIRLPLIESSIAAYPYLVFILGAVLFALSYLASFCKKLPLNVLIYFTFTIVLYFFFADLAIRTNVEQALMAQSLILGQVRASRHIDSGAVAPDAAISNADPPPPVLPLRARERNAGVSAVRGAEPHTLLRNDHHLRGLHPLRVSLPYD